MGSFRTLTVFKAVASRFCFACVLRIVNLSIFFPSGWHRMEFHSILTCTTVYWKRNAQSRKITFLCRAKQRVQFGVVFYVAPLAPRSSLPGITEESPLYEYLQTVRSLLQRQPVWDKQYLLLRVAHVVFFSQSYVDLSLSACGDCSQQRVPCCSLPMLCSDRWALSKLLGALWV